MRYVYILLFVSCLLSATSASAQSQDDTFDKLDKMLDQDFNDVDRNLENQYQAIDQAMEDAYRRLGEQVGKKWGKDQVKLPGKKDWVDYSADLKTRRIFDFDTGDMRLERVIDAGDSPAGMISDLTQAANTALKDSDKDLAGKDIALNWARQQLSVKGIDIPVPAREDPTPVLKDIAPAIDDAQLADSVSAALTSGSDQHKGTVTTAVVPLGNGKRKVVVEVPFDAGYKTTLAGRYLDVIMSGANREGLPASLVLAVMDTESSFNPRATSPIPAYGLMQLVPKSGAMDAYQYLHGDKKLVDPEYLYDPDRNVDLGTAYLGLLDQRYLAAVDDKTSRLYCTIAAYNTGAGNVARAFSGNTDIGDAASLINKMTADEVYNQLTERLPYAETRKYLVKVTQAQKKYVSYDGASL
ncbi:MAG TPA: murein transglycosylase domain-containing protein [Pseudomonadales bacterium]|nr:murein transglycosylase domain-containing protein [Pseudomonadales bacterium]